MKHIIILGDGMADWPVKSLGDKTLLQYAKTPYMDKLARMGRNGRLITVAEGFHPGSEVANMSVLGYNLPKVYEGRGPLEAASIGVDLKPGEMAMRCNLICVEGEILKNHSSGHISTEEADVLIQYLQEKLGNDRVRFHTGVQYRHLLVIKGGNKELDCTPPHDVPLKPFRPLMVKPLVPEAQETADLINDLILKSQELLKNHPSKMFRADAKAQVSYDYDTGRITTFLCSVQHSPDVEVSDFRHIIESMMVLAACEYGLDGDFTKLVNPTGRFVLGGSYADCGVTGRKLACDTYGGIGRMGGGALSGKDPTKVDRSAAYMARKIAKDIVQAGYADKCEVQLAYAIGVVQPVGVSVECFGTEHQSIDFIEAYVHDSYDLTPQGIIQRLELLDVDYNKVSAYGHFGKAGLPWED